MSVFSYLLQAVSFSESPLGGVESHKSEKLVLCLIPHKSAAYLIQFLDTADEEKEISAGREDWLLPNDQKQHMMPQDSP